MEVKRIRQTVQPLAEVCIPRQDAVATRLHHPPNLPSTNPILDIRRLDEERDAHVADRRVGRLTGYAATESGVNCLPTEFLARAELGARCSLRKVMGLIGTECFVPV